MSQIITFVLYMIFYECRIVLFQNAFHLIKVIVYRPIRYSDYRKMLYFLKFKFKINLYFQLLGNKYLKIE